LRTRLLGPTDGVRNGRRHGGIASAQADVLVRLQIVAAIPGPRVLVEALNLSIGEAVCGTQGRAVLVLYHIVRGAGAVGVGLRAEVGQGAGGTADMLTRRQLRAEALARVVFVEVGAGDTALSCKRST
jgi:hypothetical protein